MLMPFPGERRGGAAARIPPVIALLLALIWLSASAPASEAQATATPIAAVLSTRAPANAPLQVATIPPTASPTLPPIARLQALETAGNVNVRQFPDIESTILGTIAYGTEYTALRKYFRWYELRFEASPTGLAWVYGDLVTISGDASLIQSVDDLDAAAIVNQSLALLAQEDNGSSEEATDRTVEVPVEALSRSEEAALTAATRLPTFTPPAPTRAPISEQSTQRAPQPQPSPLPNIPPIVPIAALGGLGLAGLIVSMLRR